MILGSRAHRPGPLVHRAQAQRGVGAQASAAPARPLAALDHAELRGALGQGPARHRRLPLRPRRPELGGVDDPAVQHAVSQRESSDSASRRRSPASPTCPRGGPPSRRPGSDEGKRSYLTQLPDLPRLRRQRPRRATAAPMVVTPVNFKQEPFRAMPDDEWFWHVKEGVPGTLMPVWKTSLDDRQIGTPSSYVQLMYAQPFYHDPDEGDPPPPYATRWRTRSRTRTRCSTAARRSTRASARSATAARGGVRGRTAPASSRCRRTSATAATATSPTATTSGVSRSASRGARCPSWGLQYSEDELWTVVHYLRTMFTQTEPDAAQAARGQDLHVSRSSTRSRRCRRRRRSSAARPSTPTCARSATGRRGTAAARTVSISGRGRPTCRTRRTDLDSPSALNSILTFGIRTRRCRRGASGCRSTSAGTSSSSSSRASRRAGR